MGTTITAATAFSRHPREYAGLVEKIQKSKSKIPLADQDPARWCWSYRTAERLESFSFQDAMNRAGASAKPAAKLKGRASLVSRQANLSIALEASTGRRKAEIHLDNAALLSGPDSGLPMEVLGIHPRPPGRPVWIWNQPGSEKAAWREHVLVGAVLTPAGCLVRVADADAGTSDCLMDMTSRTGRILSKFPPSLTSFQIRAIQKAFDTQSSREDVEWLSESKLVDLFGNSENMLCLNARSASVSELLAALQGPGFMAFGPPPKDAPAPPVGEGPWISWEGDESKQRPGSQSPATAPPTQSRQPKR